MKIPASESFLLALLPLWAGAAEQERERLLAATIAYFSTAEGRAGEVPEGPSSCVTLARLGHPKGEGPNVEQHRSF